jgi:MOSC domain-containing protein
MTAETIRVAALATTPVKSLRIKPRSQVVVGRGGIRDDRAFFLVDDRGRMINAKHLGALNSVVADLDEGHEHLSLTFPDGEVVSGPIEQGEALEARFYSDSRPARVVLGPFSSALSEYAGKSLRLVAPTDENQAIDRGPDGAVTLISQASLASLARAAGQDDIDARRFRMSIELAGADPHEEDGWVGRELIVGEARIVPRGHVGRCLVTSRHPESGEIDLPTLDLLKVYREGAVTTEPLAFGIYAEVLREGVVRVGDPVELA